MKFPKIIYKRRIKMNGVLPNKDTYVQCTYRDHSLNAAINLNKSLDKALNGTQLKRYSKKQNKYSKNL